MQPSFNWHMPVQVRFGRACAHELPTDLGSTQVVVMAMAPAEALGLRARWQQALGPRLRRWVVVNDGLSSLQAARQLSAEVWAAMGPPGSGTTLVAVGGGTTLDLAKVLRCQPENGQFDDLARALRQSAPWPAMVPAPLWLVPTTAGTGSEVTRWATVWDTDATPPRKLSLDVSWGYADRAYVDPALTPSCPAAVTRDTALDALAHALEAIWNRHTNPTSAQLALMAARRVIDVLPRLLSDPDQPAWRDEMSLAALQAGIAFSQTRTALAHALSYDLTLALDMPHGQACALWLPQVWRLAVGHEPAVDNTLAQVFDLPAQDGAQCLADWLGHVGVDTSAQAFAQLGITDADQRIRSALASPRGQNFIAAP